MEEERQKELERQRKAEEDRKQFEDEIAALADKYATADSSMKTEIQVSVTGKVAPQAPRTPAGDTSRR